MNNKLNKKIVKGGFLFVCVYFIYLVLFYITSINYIFGKFSIFDKVYGWLEGFYIFVTLPILVLKYLFFGAGLHTFFGIGIIKMRTDLSIISIIAVFILDVVYFFVLGCLINWIILKIKNRSNFIV